MYNKLVNWSKLVYSPFVKLAIMSGIEVAESEVTYIRKYTNDEGYTVIDVIADDEEVSLLWDQNNWIDVFE